MPMLLMLAAGILRFVLRHIFQLQSCNTMMLYCSSDTVILLRQHYFHISNLFQIHRIVSSRVPVSALQCKRMVRLSLLCLSSLFCNSGLSLSHCVILRSCRRMMLFQLFLPLFHWRIWSASAMAEGYQVIHKP